MAVYATGTVSRIFETYVCRRAQKGPTSNARFGHLADLDLSAAICPKRNSAGKQQQADLGPWRLGNICEDWPEIHDEVVRVLALTKAV